MVELIERFLTNGSKRAKIIFNTKPGTILHDEIAKMCRIESFSRQIGIIIIFSI